jgi:hypothetical protein
MSTETPLPVVRERPAGKLYDCAVCHHWQPGTVVLRGNTQGWCQALAAQTTADFGCDVWLRKERG